MDKVKHKIYRMRAIDNTIIYVGQTGRDNVEQRFQEHCKDKFWINDVVEVEECPVESEAQAIITESLHINYEKPLHNKLDKREGRVYTPLRKQDKNFSHSFYVHNGIVTTAASKLIDEFEDDYILVDIVKIKECDVGIYMNHNFDMYYSITDLLKALKIDVKRINVIIDNENLFNTTANYYKSGSIKNMKNCLGVYESIEIIDNHFKKSNISIYMDIIKQVFWNCDIRFASQDRRTLQSFIIKSLEQVNEIKKHDEKVNRMIVYEHLKNDTLLTDVIDKYNIENTYYYEEMAIIHKASVLYSMMDILTYEYSTSFNKIMKDFFDYLGSINHSITKRYSSFWHMKNSLSDRKTNPKSYKLYQDMKLYSLIVVAGLDEDFIKYYELKMRNVA